MTDREKLVELLVNNPHLDVLYGEEYADAADQLIANGVTIREPGEWINQSFTLNGGTVHLYVCSKCGCEKGYEENFCPDCGAPMKGESK